MRFLAGLGLCFVAAGAAWWGLSTHDARDPEMTGGSPQEVEVSDPTRAELHRPEASAGDARTEAATAPPKTAAETAGAPGRLLSWDRPGDDPVGTLVHGTVRVDSAAGRAPRPRVSFAHEDTGVRVQAQVTAEGRYAATGLGPGTWRSIASASGHRSQEFSLTLKGTEGPVRRDVELTRLRLLSVLMKPLGGEERSADFPFRLLRELSARASAAPPGETLTEADSVGRFREGTPDGGQAPHGWVGSLELDGQEQVHVSLVLGDRVLGTELIDPGAEEVVFVVDPQKLIALGAVVTLRVVRATDGTPIEGAMVQLNGASFWTPGKPTDAGGRIEFADYEPGSYRLIVQSEGLASARRDVELEVAQRLDLGTLELGRATSIGGRVVDAEGQPIQATIEFGQVDPVDRSLRMVRQMRWRSDAQGVFSLPSLEEGEYVVRTTVAIGRDGQPALPFASANHLVSTLNGSVEDVELQLLPLGSVTVGRRTPTDDTLAFELRGPDGFARQRKTLKRVERIAWVPQGAYQLVVLEPGGEVVFERDLRVGDEPETVEIP